MNTQTCKDCLHWRERPLPADPRTGAVALDPNQPRQGNCFRGPPQFAPMLTSEGMAINVIYPPLPEAFPACDQFTPRPSANGQPDEDTVTAWWDEALHKLAEANARGEAFLADCLMQDLDARLRRAEQPERTAVIHSLIGMYVLLDKLQEQGALKVEKPPA